MRWYLLVFIVFAVEIYLRAEAAPKADRLAKRGSYSKVQLQFQKDMQDAHNAKRKLHCAPALTIDDTVCQSAQKWADQLAKTDTFKHSSTDYGENIYTSSFLSDSTPVDVPSAIKAWYDKELPKYNFASPESSNIEDVGHFTQLVWKESTSFCCAYGIASSKNVYAVCQFSPAGNWEGEFGDNVAKAGC